MGRRDDDGIESRLGQHLSIVFVSGFGAESRLNAVEFRAPQAADRGNLDPPIRLEFRKMEHTGPPARSDHTHS
jgi:hypothetical protein